MTTSSVRVSSTSPAYTPNDSGTSALSWYSTAFTIGGGSAAHTISGVAGVRHYAYRLDDAATESVVLLNWLPADFTSIAVDAIWCPITALGGDVVLQLQHAEVALGGNLTAADTAVSSVTAAAGAQAFGLKTTELVTGLARDTAKYQRFEIARLGGDAADTYVGDIDMIGLRIRKV